MFLNTIFQIFFGLEENIFAIDVICTDLWDNYCDWYTTPEYEDIKLIYKPLSLNEVWIDDTNCRNSKY